MKDNTKVRKVKEKSLIKRFNYRLKSLRVDNLKGIRDFSLEFESGKRVTAIVGANGSGKSTIIHALACLFKPKGGETSKDYNRLSDFFTPNKDATWDGSEFTATFSYEELSLPRNKEEGAKKRVAVTKEHTELYYKKRRWFPIYGRRHERESAYIGLHDLSTLNENKNAGRYKEYKTEELAHESADKIKQDMVYILGRAYESLNSCIIKRGRKAHTMFGLKYNGVSYSEHSMGAGEKRILNILFALHNPLMHKGGLLLIDEVDVLLHGGAFKRLVERIVQRADEYSVEVVFSTHRETISDFEGQVNIFGILNTGEKLLPMPHTHPHVIYQLTGARKNPIQVYVEDELAEEIVLNLIYHKKMQDYVSVTRFGVWNNAFAVLTGMKLMGRDISDTLCVLDGDVCQGEGLRESECKRHLGGNDRESGRKEVLAQIKELKIKHSAPEGQKGSPEYNIKMLLENESSADPVITTLQNYSRSIQGHSDWHVYFDEMVKSSGQRQARSKILDFLQQTNEWAIYTKEISDWLDLKASSLPTSAPSVQNSPVAQVV